jgi:hypothetical protein
MRNRASDLFTFSSWLTTEPGSEGGPILAMPAFSGPLLAHSLVIQYVFLACTIEQPGTEKCFFSGKYGHSKKKATTVYDQILVCEKYIKRCCECVCKDKTPFIT